MEKNKIDVDSLKEDQKKFLKNSKLILKTQQRFRSKKHNAFTEEIIICIICIYQMMIKECNQLIW